MTDTNVGRWLFAAFMDCGKSHEHGRGARLVLDDAIQCRDPGVRLSKRWLRLGAIAACQFILPISFCAVRKDAASAF